MEPSNYEQIPDKPRYIDFPSLEHGTVIDGKLALNRWSHTITNGHDFPGAQVRIYKAWPMITYTEPVSRQCCTRQECRIEK